MKASLRKVLVILMLSMLVGAAFSIPADAATTGSSPICNNQHGPLGSLTDCQGSDLHGQIDWSFATNGDMVLHFVGSNGFQWNDLFICMPYAGPTQAADCTGNDTPLVPGTDYAVTGATSITNGPKDATFDCDSDFTATVNQASLPTAAIFSWAAHLSACSPTGTDEAFATSSLPVALTNATVGVAPGACAFANQASSTPVSFTISPALSSVITLVQTGSPDQTITATSSLNVAPGSYTWSATGLPGFALTGVTSGSFTALSCAPGLTNSTVDVSPGVCAFANQVSSTPVSFTITPPGSSTIALIGAGTGTQTITATSSLNVPPDNYTWSATALTGFVLSGVTSGSFTAGSCSPQVLPLLTPSPSASIAQTCAFQGTNTGALLDFSNSGTASASFVVNKDSVQVDSFSLAAGASSSRFYDMLEDEAATFQVVSSGAVIANKALMNDCATVLGSILIREFPAISTPKATAVLGEKLARTGPTTPVIPTTLLALSLLVIGLILLGATPKDTYKPRHRAPREWHWRLGEGR